MPIESTTVRYACAHCGTKYPTFKQAVECEAQPITHDKGVKVGDRVRVLFGDGAGKTVVVERVFVMNKHWGHYQWERYWHTVAVEGRIEDSPFSRFLTFDAYEPI